MGILLYVDDNDGLLGERIQKVIEWSVPLESLEIFHSFNNFSGRIQRLPRTVEVAVLVARNNDQLSELISLKDYLEDIRIILILPDMESDTISKGIQLRPRFIDYVNGDSSNIGKVLEKII